MLQPQRHRLIGIGERRDVDFQNKGLTACADASSSFNGSPSRAPASARSRLGGLLRRRLGLGQQTHQFADVLRRQVAEDIGNPLFVLRRHLAEFGPPRLGQADHLHAAVGFRRSAVKMPGFDEALDQPGDVAVRDHHSLGDI